MLLPRASVQLRLGGSKAFELQLPGGSTGAESRSDHNHLDEVYHLDALLAHSLGAVPSISLLDAEAVFDPSSTSGGSARLWFTVSRRLREFESCTPLPVLHISRESISRSV